ncbi:MAG: zinc ribbon domain-containing protein [Armatimonadota bacterium]|nr:zinc ribbon domain-containing protein [Armatimonadota bacterium]
MPVYEYRCVHCRHTFERYQAVGEAPPKCPVCGNPSRKVYSSVGLIFKGSGFHTTDYRKHTSTDGEKPASSAEPSAASSASASTPASKS